MDKSKPYDEQTAEERFVALDKIQNILLHDDWRELYLRWLSDLQAFQNIMDESRTWDEFVDARGAKRYIKSCLLQLRDRVKAEKEELEALRDAGDQTSPPEYETE